MAARLPLALLAVVVLGCGGGGDAARALEETYDPAHAVRSGRLDLALRIEGEGVEGVRPVALRLRGPFAAQGAAPPRFDLAASLRTGGRDLRLRVVSTGARGFLAVGGRPHAVDPSTFATFRRAFTAGRPLGGLDARRWIEEVEDRGSARLHGVEVRHLSGPVRLEPLLADLEPLLAATGGGRAREALDRHALAGAIDRAQVDVWTGEADRVLRRLVLDVAVDVPAPESRGGARRAALHLEVGYRDPNVPQAVRAPPDPRPARELPGALAHALGGA